MKRSFSFIIIILLPIAIFGQVLTTASISGKVTSTANEPLAGANIIAKHVSSGIMAGTVSRNDGRFDLPNLRVGGPYTITATYIGYRAESSSDVFLSLGENLNLGFRLAEEAIEMSALEVVADRYAGKTGAETQFSEEDINKIPTVQRGLYDIAKLNPYVVEGLGGEINIAGRHPNYNTVKIDGAVLNDVFGLADNGMPGDQAGTQPISLDAIEELQVSVAPFDVRQSGFTGGALNAVTRSGNNQLEASAYMYTRNEAYIGDFIEDDGTKNVYPEFSENIYGVRVGGAIIKDKLHFFISAEASKKTSPNTVTLEPGKAQSYTGSVNIARVDSILTNKYGINTGGTEPFDYETPNFKLLAKLDFNLSDKHRLSFRHNFVDATDDINVRSTNNFYFGNSGYVMNQKQNSTMLNLYSSLSNKMYNAFTFGYPTIRELRDEQNPNVPSFNFGYWSAAAGAEQYSIGNVLDQDILQISDDFSYYADQHTLSAGFNLERYSFVNGFFRNFNGAYYFSDDSLLDKSEVWQYELTYSAVEGESQPFAEWSSTLLGFYGQDIWKVSDQLKLTAGLRFDIPLFPENPAANDTVAKYFGDQGIKTDQMPSGNLHLSPRLGINYNMQDENNTILRGGIGVFSGSPKFVWMSNNYSNSGKLLKTVYTSAQVPVVMDRDEQIDSLMAMGIITDSYQKSEINVVDKDLKFPQVLRTNLAIDRKLPFGLNGTVEFLYTKTLNDYKYEQVNAVKDGELMDGRDHYKRYGVTSQVYHVMQVTNTDKGYQYNLTGMVDGAWDLGLGILTAGLSYTYSQSKDINSLTSSQAKSNWKYNPVGMATNDPNLTSSLYEIPHRFVGTLGATVELMKHFPTTFFLYYEGKSGNPFSYKGKSGSIDYNGDGDARNDLVFVFDNKTQVNMIDSEGNDAWADWTAFVDQDDALKEFKGKIIDRNAARAPWLNRLDLRITQNVTRRFELTIDILNFANFLNSDWGQFEHVPFGTVDLIEFTAFEDDNFTKKPTFTFDADRYQKTEDVYAINDFLSRWQVLVGLRVNF